MASIATLYAEVLPETSKIAAGITAAFKAVDPEAREAGRRWGREIQQGMSGVDVELDADTAKAEEKIDKATRDRKTKTEVVPPDTKKTEEDLDKATRDRKTKVKVEVDQSDLSRLSSMLAAGDRDQARAFSGFLRARRDLASTQFKDPLDFADSILRFQNAESKLTSSVSSALSGAMPAVGSALTVALVGGAVAAAAGVAGALSGAIGLIPAGLGGGIAVLGTLVTGLDGVKDAWDAAGKAADSANKDGAEKAKAVASAQKTLRDAVMDEVTAQKDVANARKDARQQLEDLNVQLRGGVIDEKSAILDAQAARRDLATGRFKDSIEYQQAQLRVQQADQRVLEAHERNVQLQQKATEGNAKGVEQSDQVVAANQRLAKAHDDVATAQQNLAATQTKPSSEAEALSVAMGKLSPAAQAFIGTLTALKPAWQSLKFSVQDSLFAGIGPQIQALATQYLPVLKTSMSGLAGTMNSAFKDVGAWLSKPETMATIQQIVANIGSSFQVWSQSLVPFSQAFLTITQVGSGFLPGLAKDITDGANAFNNFIQSAAKSGDLGAWMQTGINALGALMRLLPTVGQLFLDLAPMAVPALQEIGGLLQQFGPFLQITANLLAEHPGLITGVVVAFATWKSITAVNTVLTALEGISAALTAMPAEAATAGAGMTAALGPILGTLTAAATALALWNSHGSSADPNIGPGGDERKRKLDAGKAYADAHGGKVPDGYQQWLDNKGPMPKDLDKFYVQGAAPGTPFFDAQGRPLNAQGKPFSGATGLPGPYIPNMPPSTVPGALAAAPGAAVPNGYNWDALAQAEAGGNWSNKSNPKYMGGLQFDQQTWNAYKAPEAPANAADATKEQQIQAAMNALAAGRTPESLWPQNYQKLGGGGAAMPSASAGAAPSGVMPSIPSTGATIPGGDFGASAGKPTLPAPDENALRAWVQQNFGIANTFGTGSWENAAHDADGAWHHDLTHDKSVPGHGFDFHGTTEQMDTLANWIAQNYADKTLELIHEGPGFDPSNEIKNTKRYNYGPDLNSAHRDHVHWALTQAPDGQTVPGFGGMYPSAAGMPTIASPQGVSPSGMPLGTQQQPMYVMPAQGGSGGQQLGQDMVSGVMEMFGFDGSLFKNPMDTGLFKGFKGAMSFFTGLMGGGKGGQGMPASSFQAMGGDGAAMPAMGGGGDMLSGLGGMLQGIMPQPFGQTARGGPMQAPDEFQPMLPGSGGKTGMPSNFLAPGQAQNPYAGQVDQSTTFVLNGAPPPGSYDFVNGVNVPRARQGVRGMNK